MSKKKNKKSPKPAQTAEKKAKKGISKSAKTLIISVVAVALLVGVFLLVYFVLPQQEDPKQHKNDTETAQSGTESEEETPAEYPLLTHVPADISKMEVDNETGKYTLLSETPTKEVEQEDGTTSTATEATVYTLVGFEDKTLLTGSPDTLANDCAALTAGRIVNDGTDKADFGFDSPRSTVTVTYNDGTSATVIVGDDAPSDQGTYVMMKGDENVYLVDSGNTDGFLIGAMGMLSTQIGNAATDEEGNKFTKMVLGGSLFDNNEVVFDYADSDCWSETYKITSPDEVLANEEIVTYMLNNIRSISADEVTAVDPDDKKLKELGLDEPYVTVEAEYPDTKVSYKASKPDSEDSFYLLTEGIVYKVPTSAAPWVLHSYDECITKNVLKPKYGSVSAVTVNANGTDYKFDITKETGSDESGTSETTTVKCGSTVIDESKFNVYYQNLVSAERCGGSEKPASGKSPTLTVTLTFENGTTATAEYFEGENRKSPVNLNGKFSTLAYESYVTKMIADTPTIASNGSIESIY